MPLETPVSLRTRWGAARTVRITAVSLDVGHLLTVEDVSDRVLYEQQLVESEKQAMLGLLACSILRDLANPIEALASTLVFARSTLGTSRGPNQGTVSTISLPLRA